MKIKIFHEKNYKKKKIISIFQVFINMRVVTESQKKKEVKIDLKKRKICGELS